MSCGHSLGCWTLLEADGNSLNKQWLQFEVTLYNMLSPATRCRWHNDKKLIATKPGHWIHLVLKAWPLNTTGPQEAESDIQQLTPTPENNTQWLGDQMQNSNEVTQRCPQILFHQTQNIKSLRYTGYNSRPTHIVFEGELAVKLRSKDVEVGTSMDRRLKQDQVTLVLDHSPRSTND